MLNPFFAFRLQTVQLRTHSLFAPYIDEELQNRCVSDPCPIENVISSSLTGGGTLVPTRMWCVNVFASSRESL